MMSMANLSELRQQATTARKAGEISVALPLFRRIWFEFPEDRDGWDGWGYAWCLYKQGEHAKANQLVSEVRALDPDLPALKSLQAWCLYHLVIKLEPLPNSADDIARQILALTAPDDPYGPYQRVVFRMLDACRQPFDAEATLEWLGYLDPETLSKEPESLTLPDGKTRRLPSPWLRYMGRRTEALLQLGEYAACANWCREILKEPRDRLPEGQKIWFQRRLARCLLEQGACTEAIALYQGILARKQDWFLHQELAEALLRAKQPQAALTAAFAAAIAPGEAEKKVKLWLLLADLLEQQSQNQLALRHRLLCCALRQAEGWSMPRELEDLARRHHPLPTAQTLLRELRPSWRGQSQAPDSARHMGRIEKLLPHGRAGFIRLDSGKSLYFNCQDFRGRPDKLAPGLAISCEIREGFDAKKQRSSPQAIQIRAEQPNPPKPPK